MIYLYFNFFFCFQEEDGIRDGHVTGVQTCALPISGCSTCASAPNRQRPRPTTPSSPPGQRSEERRVGKECRSRWSPYQTKKPQVHHKPRRFVLLRRQRLPPVVCQHGDR